MQFRPALVGLLLLGMAGCGRSQLLGAATQSTCDTGQVDCAGQCTDLASDAAHCGNCGEACAADELCAGGVCQKACADGLALCDGQCVDTSTDVAHCGSCTTPCPLLAESVVACQAGVCTTSCLDGLTLCDFRCVDLTNDPQNCGHCARECALGLECSDGLCGHCAPEEVLCDGFCTDIDSNVNNCGGCDVRCPGIDNGSPKCVAGACTLFCFAELSVCDGECVNLSSAHAHCGGCGNECSVEQECAQGRCRPLCGEGFELCDATCVDLQNDAANCGACGETCPALPNVISDCEFGNCFLHCADGFDDCDGDLEAVPSNGCEAPEAFGCIFPIERVSVATNEAEGTGPSFAPALSADGQRVLFYSLAPNLSDGESSDSVNLYLRDRLLRTTPLLAANPVLTSTPGLSANGAFAVFTRESDAAWQRTAIILDTAARVPTELLADGASNSYFPSISSDGSRVVFDSFDAALGPQALGYTTTTGSMSLLATTGTVPAGAAALSADGRFVVVQRSVNGVAELELLDTSNAASTRVTRGLENAAPNGNSDTPASSAAGDFIAFISEASNLVPGDTNGLADAFVFDVKANGITRISVNALGEVNGASAAPSISSDGRFVAFESVASNLVPDDTNTFSDIFVYDRLMHVVERVSLTYLLQQSAGPSSAPRIAADGNSVAFESPAADLVLGDNNNVSDVFVVARTSGAAAPR